MDSFARCSGYRAQRLPQSLLSIVRNVTVIMQILVFECKFPGGLANIRQDPLLSERCIEAINPDRPAVERSSNKTGGWG